MTGVDVVVAGAGPAGCASALTLARSGARVVVLDRARFPRDKCCGDGLTAGALRRLEALGLEPGSVPSWTPVSRVSLRSPSGRTVDLRLPEDGQHTAAARRTDLDAALVELARATGGIEVRQEEGLAGLAEEPGGLVVTSTRQSRYRAAYVVAADGAWSPTRRALGTPPTQPVASGYLGEWHAMRQYFAGAGPRAAERLWVWFEPDLLPAYAWSFPVGADRVNFGFGVVRRPGVRAGAMGPLWKALLDRPHIRSVLGADARPEGDLRAWPIPASADLDLLTGAGGRVLFVGDAGRLSDPMTGEGIAQALESGTEAARSLLAAGPDDPDGAGRAYRRTVAGGLRRDNRLAGALARVLAHPLGARASLAATDLGPWTRDHFARWMFESYPRAVLATPRRWRRGVLSPPGSYR